MALQSKIGALYRHSRSHRQPLSRLTFLPTLQAIAQVRWETASATTEPRQPDADGGVQGTPSAQKKIKYTSETYVNILFEIFRYVLIIVT